MELRVGNRLRTASRLIRPEGKKEDAASAASPRPQTDRFVLSRQIEHQIPLVLGRDLVAPHDPGGDLVAALHGLHLLPQGIRLAVPPWIDYADLPSYSRGARWQQQLHIYMNAFYYIDYCMAQTMAFQFWMTSLANRDEAWKKYLAFVDLGGTRTFEELAPPCSRRG